MISCGSKFYLADLMRISPLMNYASYMEKYEIIIYWSAEDDAFIAEVPELPGCMAHGRNYDDALTHIKQAITLWIETAQEFGGPIPEPKGRRLVFA